MYQCLAAIDIGSNTVHLIVAVTNGQQLTVLADESIFVRLAAGMWRDDIPPKERTILQDRIEATVEALQLLRTVARGFGATRVLVAATEVARAASNTDELIRTVRQRCDLDPLVLSGLDEATLTFLGVTHGRHLPTNVAVADLGGGSLEVILTELGHGTWRRSLPIGSSFMHDRFAPDDPPQPAEARALRIFVAEKLAEIPRLNHVDELLVSGGTVNALMRLVQQMQGRASGDRVLRRGDLEAALDAMLATPSALVALDFHLRPERARLLPTGTIILAALLDHLHLPGLIVSQAGIREGMILAAAHYGDDWLAGAHQGLPHRSTLETDTFTDTSTNLPLSISDGEQGSREATGGAGGRGRRPTGDVAWEKIADILNEMLGFRQDALAGKVEAIHDMRVAARRARTLLDVFAPCFPAAPWRRLNRAVKQLAQALGGVRDADVAIAGLEQRLHEADPTLAPGLRYLIKAQRTERQTARRALRRHLGKPRLERLRTLIADLPAQGDHFVTLTATRPPVLPDHEEARSE